MMIEKGEGLLITRRDPRGQLEPIDLVGKRMNRSLNHLIRRECDVSAAASSSAESKITHRGLSARSQPFPGLGRFLERGPELKRLQHHANEMEFLVRSSGDEE